MIPKGITIYETFPTNSSKTKIFKNLWENRGEQRRGKIKIGTESFFYRSLIVHFSLRCKLKLINFMQGESDKMLRVKYLRGA